MYSVARIPTSDRAFTLLELLAVMAILSVLTSLGFGLVRGAQQRLAHARTRADLVVIGQALEAYKRHFGDYPRTGNALQASAEIGSGITTTQAQALLFNALTGVYGPSDFITTLNAPAWVNVAVLRTEDPIDFETFGQAQGSPPFRPALANAFLDAWGRRFLYYYRGANLGGIAPVEPWKQSRYVLYSAGADGVHTPPDPATGLYMGGAGASGANADNVY